MSDSLSQLTAVGDGARLDGLAALRAVGLELLDHVGPVHHLAEHDVLAVQPLCALRAHEELRAGKLLIGFLHTIYVTAAPPIKVVMREIECVPQRITGFRK